MVVKVKKKKAGSYRELAFEEYNISRVNKLEDLLTEVLKIELERTCQNQNRYNQEVYSLEKAVEIMRRDFVDGLFGVFFNQKECTNLEEELEWQDENELVFIRLVMMAGRLW